MELTTPRYRADEGAFMGGEGSPADGGYAAADSGRTLDARAGAVGDPAGAVDDRAGAVDDIAGWLARAALGDQNAWASLVDRFAPTVWAVTRSEASDPLVSSEAAQTTWLRLADRLAATTDHSRFEPWLVETARREAQRSSLLRGLSTTGS